MVSANVNSVARKFGYNGVENEEALGLNLMEMDMRQYDAAIARWTGIDPITHFSNSTYNAFDNNPIYWADPSGADAIQNENGSTTYTGNDAKNMFIQLQSQYGGDNSNNESSDTDPKKKKSKKNKSNKGITSQAGLGSYFGDWSDKEEKWFEENPEKAKVVKHAAFRAATISSLEPGTGAGYGDAFRHSYWMYLIAKELGAEFAQSFGELHEDELIKTPNGGFRNNNTTKEAAMDLNNNLWGINYASQEGNSLSRFRYDFNTAVINKTIIIKNREIIPEEATKAGREKINNRLLRNQRAMRNYSRFGE